MERFWETSFSLVWQKIKLQVVVTLKKHLKDLSPNFMRSFHLIPKTRRMSYFNSSLTTEKIHLALQADNFQTKTSSKLIKEKVKKSASHMTNNYVSN